MSFDKLIHSRSALAEQSFRRYFVGACQHTLGMWIIRFLVGWIAWDLTRTAFWVGIVSACMLFPTMLLSPLFGVLSDRINTRNGLLCTLSALFLVSVMATIIIASGWLTLGVLVMLALLVGAITSAHGPLRLALMPRLVSRERLPSAIGLSAVVFNTSRIFGPMIAGFIIAKTSSTVAFGLAALLFAGGVISMLSVYVTDNTKRSIKAGMFADLYEGVHFALTTPAIRLILSLVLVNALLGRVVIELLPAVSGKLLNGTATTLATLTAAAGAGSVIGGLLLTRLRDNEAVMLRMALISLTSACLVVLPIGWTGTLWLLALFIGYLAMATTMVGTGSQALAQFIVKDEFRGRVMSLWSMVAMGAPSLGGFVMGALVDLWGFGPTLASFSLIAFVALIYLRKQGSRVALV